MGARIVVGKARRQLLSEMKSRYEGGASIRGLVGETGLSYGSVHYLLGEAGVTLRSRGGGPGPRDRYEHPPRMDVLKVIQAGAGPMVAGQIVECLLYPRGTVYSALRHLFATGQVARLGKQRGGKYQITDKGRKALREYENSTSSDEKNAD